MTPPSAITRFFKLLAAIAFGYCIATLLVLLGATEQQPQFPAGSGSALLWCSLAILIFG
jgi:hypothetical protein